MRINSPNRRISALTGMGILFLAIAVFGWGVKYKLSLYDAPGSFSTHIVQAKLLSQKERPVRNSVVDAHAATPLPQSSLFYPVILAAAFIFRVGYVAPLRSTTIMADDSRRQCGASLSFFSFRPPPVSA